MKRFLYASVFALLVVSCKQEATNHRNETSTTTEQQESPESKGTPEETEEAPKIFDYYAGTIGLYGEDVLVEIQRENLQLSGRYWYLKHGKQIVLKGDASVKSGEWQLTESVNKVVTGYMTLQAEGDRLTGQWYAPGRKSDVQTVDLKKVHSSEKDRFEPSFETYTLSKAITIYNGESDDEETASDDIRLVRIGSYVLFQYFVIGSNAHTGHINGLAKFESENKAIFQGEEACQLSLHFDGKEITILEDEDCSYYRGARAYFEGTLTKAD